MKLTGAAILVSGGMKVLQAAPAAYPYRWAAERFVVPASVYSLMMRSHARLSQPIGRAYATLVRGLARAATEDWSFDPAKAPSVLREGEMDLLVVANLTRCYHRRVRCTANFPVREPDMPDAPVADDWFALEWRPTPHDYAALIQDVLPAYLRAFRPYRATIGPDDLAAIDFDCERTLNGRYEIGRLYPVDYLHDDLCRAAFCRPAAACVQKLREGGIVADAIAGGLLIREPRLLTIKACDDFNKAIRHTLGLKQSSATRRTRRST